ncbi:MAG: ribbon-helix-helix domain-containing protein [Propionicimonas sp.]
MPVRLDDSLLTAVDQRAEQDHTTRSDVIRAAIRAYVA